MQGRLQAPGEIAVKKAVAAPELLLE